MGNERLFFGLLLVTAGLVVLLQNLGLFPAFSWWRFLGDFWPVLLIFLGISLVAGRSSTLVLLLVLIALLLGGSCLLLGPARWQQEKRVYPRQGGPGARVENPFILWEEGLDRAAVAKSLSG